MEVNTALSRCAEERCSPMEMVRPTISGSRAGARGPGQEHLFVNNVRFWSMLAIIAMHSCAILVNTGRASAMSLRGMMTPFKFGTIAFFLASGFLLGERMEACAPVEYLRRRLEKIFVPWTVWLSLLVFFFLGAKVVEHRVTLRFDMATAAVIAHKYYDCTFMTAFWFVPNLLLSLAILLLFRRYLRSAWFGAMFLAVDVFYSLNVYAVWMRTHHTEAMLGYVFYLWLGTYAARHFGRLNAWIERTPASVLVGVTIAAGLLAYQEAALLEHLGSADPLNTLRLSNQIFSVAVVLLLLKVRKATSPGFVDVRRHTFGIYLSHSMVQIVLVSVLADALAHHPVAWILDTAMGRLGLWLAVTGMTYGASLAITKWIDRRPRLRWAIGMSRGTEAVRLSLVKQRTPGAKRDGSDADAVRVRGGRYIPR